MRHKQITEQHKLYDTNLYDYLSFLNTTNNPNQQQPNTTSSFNAQSNMPFSYFSLGYKFCKWNNNGDRQLLSVINACNQLLLFDCTNLNRENVSGCQKLSANINLDGQFQTSNGFLHTEKINCIKLDSIHKVIFFIRKKSVFIR